ncbi:MAG: DUF4423 domain-containing protein [Myxococcota bacterium]
MDHERLSSEFLRALRGGRSQTGFSRRLGFRSNVAYTWEAGLRFPSADEAMVAADRSGHDVEAALLSYCRVHLGFGAAEKIGDLRTVDGMASFLRSVQGSTLASELASRCGKNRHAVARWLRGETRIRLPDLLLLLEVTNRSLLTFLSGFVSPAQLPTVSADWARVQALGSVLFDGPDIMLMFVGLGLTTYRELPRHEPGWLARRVGISLEREIAALETLRQLRVIAWNGRRWLIDDGSELDTRRYPHAYMDIKRMFGRLGLERIGDGNFNYVVLSISSSELERLYTLQREVIDRVRSIATEDRHGEDVVMFTVQVAPLAERTSTIPPDEPAV